MSETTATGGLHGGDPTLPPLPKTLVTGGLGAGRVEPRAGAARARRRRARVCCVPTAREDNLADLAYERVDRRRARPSQRAASPARRRPGVPRGRADVAAHARGRPVPHQRRRHPHRARGVPAGGRGARGLHLVGGRDRPRPARVDGRRDPGLRRRRLRHPLRQRQARGRGPGPAAGRPRAAGGDRQPRLRVRARRHQPLVDRDRAPLPAPPDPGLRGRRAEHRRRPATSPRGHLAADERGEPGERYILGNRNYTLDRLFADLGRLSGVEPPAVKLPLHVALAFAEASAGCPGGRWSRWPRCAPPACGGRAATRRPSATWAGARPRTRTRSRPPSTGTGSATARAWPSPAPASRCSCGRAGALLRQVGGLVA